VVTTTARHDVLFPAMGTDAHVIVVGGTDALLEQARRRIEELEALWSRFRPSSELCRLNAAAGDPVVVSPLTFELVRAAIEAWRDTGGRFDATVLAALVNAGYDRDFATVDRDHESSAGPQTPAPGCIGIVLDPVVEAITLPRDTALDLGGIGKGFAADVVTRELLEAGAEGACVNLGGDLRARGRAPDELGWVIEVEAEPGTGGTELPRLALLEGGVATTSRARRTWHRRGRELHHVIDPGTGAPARGGLVAVTVISGTAAHAAVVAKAAFVAGVAEAPAVITGAGATGLLVDDHGRRRLVPGVEPFLA